MEELRLAAQRFKEEGNCVRVVFWDTKPGTVDEAALMTAVAEYHDNKLGDDARIIDTWLKALDVINGICGDEYNQRIE
jgi:hypothetical protein